jgi:hypothetical protein
MHGSGECRRPGHTTAQQGRDGRLVETRRRTLPGAIGDASTTKYTWRDTAKAFQMISAGAGWCRSTMQSARSHRQNAAAVRRWFSRQVVRFDG